MLKQIDLSATQGPSVEVAGAIQQAMNLRTATVESGTLWKYIKTVGTVQCDEDKLVHVHPRAAGWVEKLRVRAEGDAVERGEPLLDLYAPDILNAQVDFLIALKQTGQDANSRRHLDNARNRLRSLEVPNQDLGGILRFVLYL